MGLTYEPLADLVRVERGIRLPDRFDDGLAMFEAGTQGSETGFQPGREVRPSGAAWAAGCRVRCG